MFDESNRDLVRKQLAETLRVTIAQKLVYSAEKQRRYPACEIMVVTPTIKDYIHKNNTDEIYSLLQENNIDDMISMNGSLVSLVSHGLISREEAVKNSNDENELEKMFRGVYQGTKAYYE
jgi:Tfp pilus assembly pilus retraction ATPase PilT